MIEKIYKKSIQLEALYKEIEEALISNKLKHSEALTLKSEVENIQKDIVNRNNNKIQQIQLKQEDENGSIIIEDDFANSEKVVKNNGFEIIQEMSVLRISPLNRFEVKSNGLITAENNDSGTGVVTFSFDRSEDMSYINALFKNNDGVMVAPVAIKYKYRDDVGELTEEFERFFDRKASDESCKYYFYAKTVDKVIFYFDVAVEDIDLNISNIAFYLEEFSMENDVILKYSNTSTANKLKVTKNFFDKLGSISCYVSGDNDHYDFVEFEGVKAIINNPKTNSLYFKIVQETVIESSAKEDQIEEGREKHVKSVDYTESDKLSIELLPNDKYIDSEAVKINVPFSVQKSISAANKSIIKKDDGKYFIDDNFVEYSESIPEDSLDILKDFDDVEAIGGYNKPIFFFDTKLNKLHFPKFFREEELSFRVSFEEILFQEVLAEKYYTPFLFDLYIEE